MNRHIFLTGEKQVGKSTLLHRVIESLQLCPAGFRTLPFDVGGERKGYVLHSLVPLPPFENDCPVVVRMGERKPVPVLPVYETIGISILEKSLLIPSPVLLMDELGKAERDAPCFLNAVRRCLDSEKCILGVIQQGEYPLFAEIAARPDIQIILVTKENREALFPILTDAVRQLLGLVDLPVS